MQNNVFVPRRINIYVLNTLDNSLLWVIKRHGQTVSENCGEDMVGYLVHASKIIKPGFSLLVD